MKWIERFSLEPVAPPVQVEASVKEAGVVPVGVYVPFVAKSVREPTVSFPGRDREPEPPPATEQAAAKPAPDTKPSSQPTSQISQGVVKAKREKV